MFRYGFAEGRAFLEACDLSLASMEEGCAACDGVMRGMVSSGFDGRAATASEARFSGVYDALTRDLAALAALRAAADAVHADAQLLKSKSEAVAASVGAPCVQAMAWESSEAAVDGSAAASAASVRSVRDCEASDMEEAADGASAALEGVAGSGAAAEAVSVLKASLADQKSKLGALAAALDDLAAGVSAFEASHRPVASGVAEALSASGDGSDFIARAKGSGYLSDVAGKVFEMGEGACVAAQAQALSSAGIHKIGTHRVAGDKVILSGFETRPGAKQFPTRVNLSNATGSSTSPGAAAYFKSLGAARAAKGLGTAGSVATVGLAFWEEYSADPTLPEDRRVSNAATEAAIEGGGVAFSTVGTVAGAAIGSAVPVIGTAAGAVIGFAFGFGAGFVYDEFIKDGFFHAERDDGTSVADDLKDAVYDMSQGKPKMLDEDADLMGGRAHGPLVYGG